MWYAWEWKENCARFLCESPNEAVLSEDLGVDGRMGKKWILGRLAGGVWSRFSWLRIGLGGGLL
jgi:hypothetical protein